MSSQADARRASKIGSAIGRSALRTARAFIPDAVLDIPKNIADRQRKADEAKDTAIWANINQMRKKNSMEDAKLEQSLIPLLEQRETERTRIERLKNIVSSSLHTATNTNRPDSGTNPSKRVSSRATERAIRAVGQLAETSANYGKLDDKINGVLAAATLAEKAAAENSLKKGDITGTRGQRHSSAVRVVSSLQSRGYQLGGVKRRVYKSVKKTIKTVAKRPIKKPVKKPTKRA